MADHLAGRAGLQDHAVVQDRQLVGESLRLLQLVGHQHGRDPAVRNQGPDQVGEAAAEAGVEPRVRLVQEQSVAPGQQQAAERDPVLLAAGQPGGIASSRPSMPSRAASAPSSGPWRPEPGP